MKLPHGRAPHYRLKENYGSLLQGTFIRPIEFRHLARHTRIELGVFFNEEREVVCYTPQGTMAIPRDIIEEV